MQRAIAVRGRLINPSTIALDEPVSELTGEVEAIPRAATGYQTSKRETVFELSVTKFCGQPVDQAAHSSARASADVGAGADRPYSR